MAIPLAISPLLGPSFVPAKPTAASENGVGGCVPQFHGEVEECEVGGRSSMPVVSFL